MFNNFDWSFRLFRDVFSAEMKYARPSAKRKTEKLPLYIRNFRSKNPNAKKPPAGGFSMQLQLRSCSAGRQ
jgi:hypothetical protein